jgi:hypothetical protein
MNDAEMRFAERLALDLEQVLGAGIAIDDVELTVREAADRQDGEDGAAHLVAGSGEESGTEDLATVRATLLVEGRVETIDVHGPDVVSLYRPLIERAAELRLRAAFWRLVGPA